MLKTATTCERIEWKMIIHVTRTRILEKVFMAYFKGLTLEISWRHKEKSRKTPLSRQLVIQPSSTLGNTQI
jgi:hypothetical protein